MSSTRRRTIIFRKFVLALIAISAVLALTDCTKKSNTQITPADLRLELSTPFHFVAYGDTRFHDPTDAEPANPAVRVALVKAIAASDPAFVCFTGDIVYNGYDSNDWKVWDSETSIWKDKKIPIYPALGNHDLHGDPTVALANYFRRFPALNNSRYYSVRAVNTLILVLDSSLDEITGPQGEWLASKLDHVPSDVDFVFLMDHHPPYTSSSDAKLYGGGHSSRETERALAKILEERQAHARYRMIVFSGHVHNYERHEHGGVTYFVSGGGGAHAYPIDRGPDDPFKSKEINYHYLVVSVDRQKVTVTMNRLDLTTGKAVWTQPDSVNLTSLSAATVQAAGH